MPFQLKVPLPILRLARLCMLLAVALGIYRTSQWRQASVLPQATLEMVKNLVPSAGSVGARTPEGLQPVLDAQGSRIGAVALTLPEEKKVMGYCGPSQVLVALGLDGRVTGWQLISSPDTPEHLEMVLRNKRFSKAYAGWKPGDPPPAVEGVSGATLTSLAISESIKRRLSGATSAGSFVFPEAVSLDEAKVLFPTAATLTPEGRKLRVASPDGSLLGWLVRTAPEADEVRGYQGPTEVLAALAPAGDKVLGIKLRRSYDNESYVDTVRGDRYYLGLFRGRTPAQLANMDYAKEGIEGVSGATETSYAVAESLKKRFASPEPAPAAAIGFRLGWQEWATVGIILGACLMAFTPLRGSKVARGAWQVILVGFVGLYLGALLSLNLFGGWMQNGVAWKAAPGLVLLAFTALLAPWGTRRQLYCHHICPHGVAQLWVGKLTKRKWTLSPRVASALGKVPGILLLLALASVAFGWGWKLAALEPFDAWIPLAANVAAITLALLGLAASAVVPQVYCHYGCPTGAIFKFLRTTGHADHWGRRDWLALVCVAMAWIPAFTQAGTLPQAAATGTASPALLRGEAFGTTWSIKIRGAIPPALDSKVRAVLAEVDALISTWRPDSELARFNALRHTGPVPVSPALAAIARSAASVGRDSSGALDCTIAPLVRAWGYGAPPHSAAAPDAAAVATMLTHCGWDKIEMTDSSLRKKDPAATLDLTAIGEGYALERMAELLVREGCAEFLVELGGELFARGSWQVAIESSDHTVLLDNTALSTSGTYRQSRVVAGSTISHLIDPRTGSPITHRTVSVSVRHPRATLADAWATALAVLGAETGLVIAEQHGIDAEFTVESDSGVRVLRTETAPWKSVHSTR